MTTTLLKCTRIIVSKRSVLQCLATPGREFLHERGVNARREIWTKSLWETNLDVAQAKRYNFTFPIGLDTNTIWQRFLLLSCNPEPASPWRLNIIRVKTKIRNSQPYAKRPGPPSLSYNWILVVFVGFFRSEFLCSPQLSTWQFITTAKRNKKMLSFPSVAYRTASPVNPSNDPCWIILSLIEIPKLQWR